MFFTKAGKVMAWLLVVSGGAGLMLGYAIRYGDDPTLAAEVLRGRSANSLIKSATDWLVMGLGLGILAEISRTLASSSRSDD